MARLRLTSVAENARYRRYLDACHAVAGGAGCPPELDRIGEDVLPGIVSALYVDAGAIYLADESGSRFGVFAHFGLRPDGAAELSSPGLLNLVWQGGLCRPSVLDADGDGLPADLGLSSVVLVPLETGGKQIGALLLGTCRRQAWAEQDLLLLKALGVQLASALSVARRYELCSREEERLRTMSSVAFLVGRAGLDEVLNAALRAALDLSGLETGAVLLIDERSRLVSVRAAFGLDAELALRVPPVSVDRGLTGEAVRTGEIQVSGEVPLDGRVAFDIVRESGLRTLVVIPLLGKDRVIGTINLAARRSRSFDAEDLAFLQAIGNQAGIVIENSQLYAQTKRRLEQLAAVHATSLDVVGQLDLQDLFRAIVERATKLLHGKDGGLSLSFPERGELELVATCQPDDDRLGKAIPLGQGALGHAVSVGEPLVISDYDSYPHRLAGYPQGAYRAAAIVPLRWGQDTLGVLAVADDAEDRTFDEDDVDTLQLFAAYASLALQNARLYTELKRQLSDSQALLDVAEAITATLDLPELLDRIVRAAVDTIPKAESAVIHLLTPTSDELVVRAASYRQGSASWDPEMGKLKVGQGIAGCVIREGRMINIADVAEDPRFVRFPGTRPFKSLVVAPLSSCREKLGTLSLTSKAKDAFDPHDERLLALLSAQASVAIARARLHEETVRRAEEVKEAYQALRQVERLKDEFVARVSHEIKSPLAPMRIALERTLDGAFGSLNETQREMIDIALANLDRLNATTTDLLDVVRLGAEGEEDIQQTFDLCSLVEESVAAMRPRAEAASVNLATRFDDGPLMVLADRRKIGQVVSNLLSNAIKFNRPSGEVTVHVRESGDEWAEVSVVDTGIGIPAEELDKIFGRFYQVEGHIAREYQGLGLGLAIVKEYVELAGGTVRVESEEGKGSTFTFTVPRT